MAGTSDRIPPIRKDLEVLPQYYRGALCYVIRDPVTRAYYRLREAEYLVLRCFQRGMDVEATRHEVQRVTGAEVPETEVYKFVNQLKSANLLKSKGMSDVRDLAAGARRARRRKLKALLSNYLFITIPLWKPDRFLERLLPLYRLIISPPLVALWILVAASGAWVIATHFWTLVSNAFSLLSGWNLLILSVVIFLTKFVHEMGHALTCKHLGGEVRSIGPAFLVFQPCMFTDTTDAWAFPSKWDRIKVTAAGAVAEIVLASAAAFAWISSEPGLVKQVSYTVMVACTVGTILFNANPLLRFDGYYILSDLLEVPNLRGRTAEYLNYVLDHYALGLDTPAPAASGSDRRICLIYGVARFIYRWIIIAAIGLFLLSVFVPLGVLMLATSFYGMVVQPVWRRGVMMHRQLQAGRIRVRALLVIGLICLVIALVWQIPVDYTVQVPCVVAPGRIALLRTPSEGQVASVLVREGDTVAEGQALARMENPILLKRAEKLREQIRETDARIRAALVSHAAENEVQVRQKKKLVAELRLLQQKIEKLTIRAPHAGTVLRLRRQEAGLRHDEALLTAPSGSSDVDLTRLEGLTLTEGAGLMAVAAAEPVMLKAFVREYDVSPLKHRDPISCRLASHPGRDISSRVRHIMPVDVKTIENVGVTLADIGYIPVKPGKTGENEPLVTLYVVEAELGDVPVPLKWGLTGKAYITYGRGPLGPFYVGRIVRNLKLRLQRI